MGWAEETGQIRAGIGPWLDKRSRERRAFVARTTFPTRGDKSVRAQSIRGRAALNGLYVPMDAPWRGTFEAELLSFPAVKHDDIVDSSESVRDHPLFLANLLSMSRIDASIRKARALRLRHSQSFANRRHRPNHANVRSTTHRLGSRTNPLA